MVISEQFERVLKEAFSNPGHDYPEDFDHENGRYLNLCIKKTCGVKFMGGKYRFICKLCNEKMPGKPVGQGL